MIVRNIVTEENEIKKILSALCQQYPIKCTKENISGLSSNDRVIIVRGQFFQYYNCPSKFKNGDLSALTQQNFKARIKLSDIYEVAFLPQKSINKKTMTLSMPLQKITATNIQIYKQKATKKVYNVKNQQKSEAKQIICWLFNFDFNVKQAVFKKLEQQQKKKREKQSQIIKYDPESDLVESILNVTRQNKENKQNTIVISAEQQLDKNVEKLREMKELIQFQDKIKKQEQERLRAIKLSMSLRKMQKGETQQEQQEDEPELYPIKQAWKDFWKVYQKVSKYIGQPISKEYLEKQLNLLNQIHKIEQQLKIIYQEYINFRLVGWSPQKVTFDQYEYYKGIWIKLGGKQLNQQFLSNYYLSDLMYIIKPHKKMKFRIAPMFLMQYKGFKGICMIDLPFSSIKGLNKQIYSVKTKITEMDTQIVEKIKDNLEIYERIMNIKNQNYVNGNYETNAPLGHDVKVFYYDNKFQDSSTNYLENFYYVTGVKGLFPIDYCSQFRENQPESTPKNKKKRKSSLIQQKKIQKYQPEYCLRPQIIAQYRDFMQSIYRQDNQILTQAFKHSEISLQVKGKQDVKAVEISQKFIPIKINELMNQFNKISLIMIDSYSIKKYMSQMGINSRYLGKMYKATTIPYIQQTLQIQMLSRTIKNIYCQSIKDLVSSEEFFKRQMYMKKHKQLLIESMKIHHDLMINNAIDFLNLVFGNGTQSVLFWKIVLERCHEKYQILFAYPLKVKLGCLLHAILWHCKFVINFELDIKLFQTQKPFDVKRNWCDFRFESKAFQFPSFQICKIIKKLAMVDQKNEQQAKNVLSLLKIQLLHHNMSFGNDFRTQITLAKINNLGKQLEKPLRQSSYHPSELPYYFINKSHENFKKALDIINFSLASNHPLFISLYDTYSELFEPQLLKKATLLAAIKGLGEFHPRTTQLYSNFYRQGLQQFEVKAKRSQQMQAALTIIEQFFSKGKFQTCVNFCFTRIDMRIKQKSSAKGHELQLYLNILRYGLISAIKTRQFAAGLKIVQEYSEMINAYKIRNFEDHEFVLQNALIICLSLTSQKFYIYKMVLLAIKIQQQFQNNLPVDQFKLMLPRSKQERDKIIIGIINQYYLQQTHSKWIQYILLTLRKGYKYFNHLSDLFNNYKYHINNYGSSQFQRALGYLDVLIRYFGQKIFFDHLYQNK